jgi:hypothetical protein
MKRVTVTVDDDFYDAIHELARRMDAPISGLVRYSVDRAFYDELDEIFCQRVLQAERPDLFDGPIAAGLNPPDYHSRHDWRMQRMMEFMETIPYVNP